MEEQSGAAEFEARCLKLAAPPRPRNPRPIVVMGAGSIVQDAHLPAYQKAGFPVVALTDVLPGKAEALAKEYGIERSFQSVKDAVRFAPSDAVFDVAVPAPHLLEVLRELPDNVPVLLQKPMGENIGEARAIRDLCRAKGLIAAVNFQLRYAPNMLAARALMAQGLTGELHDMEVQVRTFMPWAQWSFLNKAPRLEILYHSIHYVDLARSWMGNPKSVSAKTVRHPAVPHLSATKTVLFFDYGDWKRVFITANHGFDLGTYDRSFVQWEGLNGAMRATMGVNLDYPKGVPDDLHYIARAQDKAKQEKQWHSFPVTGNWFPDAFMGSMGALQAFAEGSAAELPSRVDDAFQTMALVEAAFLSSEAGGHPIAWE
ncbi:MAG: Gfo/Idh/MocA family protein [Acidobacteriaceae bacterium]